MAETMQNRTNPLVDTSQIISALAPVFLGSGTTKTNTTSLDPKSMAALQQMLAPGGAYGKAAAVTDSNDAISNAMKLLMQQSAPGVIAQGNQTGGYGSTAQALELNDLTARIAGQGAQLQLDNIGKYAGIQQSAAQTLKGAKTSEAKTTGPIVNPLATAAGTAGALILNNLFGGSSGDKKGTGSNTEASGTPDTGIAPAASKGMVDLFDVNGSLKNYAEFFAGNLKNSVTDPVTGTTSTGGWDQFVGAGKGLAGQIISEESGGVLNQVTKGVSDFIDEYCFITTAVCRSAYKADDCRELTTLRKFRDTYMQETEERKWLVAQYYREAPGICAVLESFKEAERLSIYKAFDTDFIQPAIAAIEVGDNEKAFNIYRALFEVAKELAVEKTTKG